jgi:DNA repair protein RadA/Sms
MKTNFVCQSCGAFSPKWLGRCPTCEEYNTMVEEAATVAPVDRTAALPEPLAQVPYSEERRRSIGNPEMDRVLGGGLVKGSLILLGGDPGIGKSTLMLQISDFIARAGGPVLYVSGEESAYQVRLRAERLGITGQAINFIAETDLDVILASARALKPDFMIIDSIQTVYRSDLNSAPGSVAQVRECGSALMKFAKESGVTTAVIGHVTKFGVIAGPKTLEHIVDTVLYFEGDKDQQYRILRSIKNRFGATNEIGVFEMTGSGLKEVANPSRLFMSDSGASGSVIVSVIEGSRPLLVEVQALTSPTFFNYPQRVATGIDYKRLAMLLAVLERRAGINVYGLDCFVNAVGGIKVFEPSSDLGIILAIASSIKNRAIPKGTIAIGEVGLGGEIRPVYGLDLRLKEAEKLGLTTALVPKKNAPLAGLSIAITGIADVREAVNIALGL